MCSPHPYSPPPNTSAHRRLRYSAIPLPALPPLSPPVSPSNRTAERHRASVTISTGNMRWKTSVPPGLPASRRTRRTAPIALVHAQLTRVRLLHPSTTSTPHDKMGMLAPRRSGTASSSTQAHSRPSPRRPQNRAPPHIGIAGAARGSRSMARHRALGLRRGLLRGGRNRSRWCHTWGRRRRSSLHDTRNRRRRRRRARTNRQLRTPERRWCLLQQ